MLQQMHLPVPLRGMLSVPFRGIRHSSKQDEPEYLHHLRVMFTRVMKARKVSVDATVLFADLRGYTGLSQSLSPDAISGLLDTFYDECANAIWAYDGLLNKTIGDAVMAIFNFPIRGEDHANRAVRAAREIQKRWASERETLARTLGVDGSELGVGIGIHCGELSFGEFGRSHRDLTAIGTVVNTASRAQTVADADQILVTAEVYRRARSDLPGCQAKAYRLKGFEAPIELYAA